MANFEANVSLRGDTQLVSIFMHAADISSFMKGVGAAAYSEANEIMRASKEQVPLRDGQLRGSGMVQEPQISGTNWSITMGYGGAASAYALIQHENLSFHHPQEGRKAKYLSDPFRDALPGIEDRMSEFVVRYFATGGF